MTTKAYGADLRVRVIAYIQEGNSQKSACLTFKVSSTTASRWYKEYKAEGRIQPKLRGGSKVKIPIEHLIHFVDNNPNAILVEIGKHFGVSAAAIHTRLKQLGYRYKKKRTPTWKLVLKNEQHSANL